MRKYRDFSPKKPNDNIQISIPNTPKRRDTKYQIKQKRKKFRRRASIEPIIAHMKLNHRLSRNYLKGFIWDGLIYY